MKWRWMFFLHLFLILILFHCCCLLQKFWSCLLFLELLSLFSLSIPSVQSLPVWFLMTVVSLHSYMRLLKTCCCGDKLSWCNCLYLSGGAIFSWIPFWVSFSCLHGCLPSQLTASVFAQGEGAVRYFRGKDANSSAAGSRIALLKHSPLSNGVQQVKH